MAIFGSKWEQPDTFSFMKTNPNLQAINIEEYEKKNHVSLSKYTKGSGKNLTKYWDDVERLIAQRLTDINKIKFDDSNFNFTLNESDNNLYANRDAWNVMKEISSNGGYTLAFDTETIGDFTGELSKTESKVAGITEIGIYTEKFIGENSGNAGRVHQISNPPGSFFFGIDSDQKKWLESILDKKIRGEALTKTEESAMERASRHSILGDTKFETFTATWGWGKEKREFTFVKQLNESRPNDILHIQSGIDEMAKRYNPNREEQISYLVNGINKFSNKNKIALGQNLSFDITAINRYSDLHHTNRLSKDFQYIDLMFGIQAAAKEEGITSGEFIKKYNLSVTNERLRSLEASAEAILDNTEFSSGGHAHTAFHDSGATTRVLKNKELKVIDKALKALDTLEAEPTTISLNESYIKINSKGNIRSRDIVTINGKAAGEYQVTNQYWKFEGIGNGTLNGIKVNDDETIGELSDRYIVKFTSANGDGATLYKSFQNQADFEGYLRYNTSIISKSLLSEEDIKVQSTMHDSDIARREIDRFFDTNVTKYYSSVLGKEVDSGGFASFKKYYDMYQDLASLSDKEVTSIGLLDGSNNLITTSKDLLANIDTNDNIVKIIDYADKHDIDSIVSNFRDSLRTQDKTKYTAEDLAIKKYSERKIMQHAFNMFEDNSDFFSYADYELSKLSNNLVQTIAFSDMKKEYLKTADRKIQPLIYTIDDLNSVSIARGNKSIRIDVNDVDRGARQLFNAVNGSKKVKVQVTDELFNIADELKKRGLLTKRNIDLMKKTHSLGQQPFALADSIVMHLNKNTKDVRELSLDQARKIKEMVSERPFNNKKIEEIALSQDVEEKTVRMLKNKDIGTLFESSSAEMTLYNGKVSKELKDYTSERISSLKGIYFAKKSFDNEDFDNIKSILQKMNYDDASIEDYSTIFYANGNGKSNIAKFNNNLKEGQDPIRAIFYKPNVDESSAFTIVTRDKDYAKVMDALSHVEEEAFVNKDVRKNINKEVKKSLENIASYQEIPYLEVIDIEDNDTIRNMTTKVLNNGKIREGHGARVVLAKQGENFYKYDTMSLNMYAKDFEEDILDENGKPVMKDGKVQKRIVTRFTGEIRDQGGSYLTSIRPTAPIMYEEASYGRYSSGSRISNRNNVARMTEQSSSPQMSGTYDLNGEHKKIHTPSQKDIGFAYVMALDPGEGNLGLKDILKELTSQEGYDSVKTNGVSREAENAIRGIYKAFDEYYELSFKKNKNDYFNKANIKAVYDSEQFQHFYQRYLTSQTGGIGTEGIIQGILNNEYNTLNKEEIRAVRNLQKDSLLQIMYKATQENDLFTDDLRDTLHLLAYDAGLNAVGSEAFVERMEMYVDNFSPQSMNNSVMSGPIRPTYSQRENYRGYRLDGMFFDNAEELEKELGINFGDIFTSEDYINKMQKEDTAVLKKANVAVDSAHVSRRNIIGAVQSISDAELNAGYEEGLKIIRANKELDTNALEKIYVRMMGDMNMYEGKAYMRPSVANQEFFMLTDPKNIRLPEIQAIFETGTDVEQKATQVELAGLIGKKVKSGDVIGKRLNNNGNFVDIIYRGQTINEFTEQNALELMANGKTSIITERQLEGFKVMAAEEKATAETLSYFTSIDPVEREKEIIETLKSFGLDDQGNFKSNVRLMNKYTDTVMNIITRTNTSDYKTILINNNNIIKHLSDISISSQWDIIMNQFKGKTGLNQFIKLAGDIQLEDGTLLQSHIKRSNLYGAFTYDSTTKPGSVNVLDEIIERLKTTKDPELIDKAKKIFDTFDIFEENDIAFLPIQRQQMNTFQGQSFKMDQRLYQNLVMQELYAGDNAKYGAELAELIRGQIQSGYYDTPESMGKIGYKNIDSVWADMVTNRRGLLKPKEATDMLLGTLDAIEYINGNFDIETRNVTKINLSKILENIPETGGDNTYYRNFIFKVNGELSNFMKANAIAGQNTTVLSAGSNSFYLDMSSLGEFKFNGQKNMTGILLPYQHINTVDEDIFVGESTRSTINFFNTLKRLEIEKKEGKDISTKISDALDDLFKAYGKELNSRDKNSLISKALFKMKMPSSSGALAKDAIVPTLYYDGIYDDINSMRSLEHKIVKNLDETGSYSDVTNYINELKELRVKQADELRKQKDDIYNLFSNKNLNKKDKKRRKAKRIRSLHLTSHDKKYAQYIKGQGVIESAVVTSKQMFEASGMDTGHIGWQIVKDYFDNNGHIVKYDNFSKITEKEFEIAAEEFSNILFGSTNSSFDEALDHFMRTFNKTDHEKWAKETFESLYEILNAPNKTYKTKFDRHSAIFKKFNESVEKHLVKDINKHKIRSGIDDALNSKLLAQEKREFLGLVNSLFENIGDRYASEVGILGLIGRYPFFTESGTLPVRIFLNEALKGNEVRFLGPQFSIFQKLDFDGDTEFLKFLGNGGLLAKNAREAELLQHQFNRMNSHNLHAFVDSLNDSIKSYRYGDKSYFKSKLLEELDKDKYNSAISNFVNSLNDEEKAYIETLKKEDNDLYGLIMAHTKPMKDQFTEFNKEFGSTMSNADMVKAAIQARLAKQYIGNYSKPNLEVRNALMYMMSFSDNDDELNELRQIRDVLFGFDEDYAAGRVKVAPGGLLTILEQQGIDTKHIHDAATLNNSSAWRVGITKLFNNAKGAPKVDTKKQREALINLIEGSKKIFFNDTTDKQEMLSIANEILSKPFNGENSWTETIESVAVKLKEAIDTGDTIAEKALQEELDSNLGKAYLSGLYKMSQMDNAYQGFKGTFRTNNYNEIFNAIQNMDMDKIIAEGFDYDSVILKALKEASENHQTTDDAFAMFNRRIRNGDLLIYQGNDGPIGYVFENIDSKRGIHKVRVKEYSFESNKKIGKTITLTQGYSIKELNERIKKHGNGALKLLDVSQLDTPERNINIRNIDNASADEIKFNIHGHIAEVSMQTRLQDLFDSINDIDFEEKFDIAISQSQHFPGYGEKYNPSLGRIMSDIVGKNKKDFKRRITDINERIQFGIDSGMITTKSGSKDAKELIRSINKEIAAHPRDNIGRISGKTTRETIENYLAGTDATIRNYNFLDRSLKEVELSNDISIEIKDTIKSRNDYVNELAKDFYNKVVGGTVDENQIFEDTKKAWQTEIDSSYESIMKSIKRSSNAEQEMMYQFGWNNIPRKDNFIISADSDILKKEARRGINRDFNNAKVGFGQFTGFSMKDLSSRQQNIIQREIEEALPNLKRGSLEWIAATNTDTLLKSFRAPNGSVLDFTNAETLRTNYKSIFNPDAVNEAATEAAQQSLNESVAQATKQANNNIEKKTLLKDIKQSFKNHPNAGKYLKIGAGLAGGAAVIGLVGHALFNKKDNEDVEVPASINRNLNTRDVDIENKNDLEYENAPTQAQSTQRQHKIAPPSLPKNRTIYHDGGSGFNFKVSAQSYNKLQAESYQNMMQGAGLDNNKLHVTRDNSRITDNWLENKFAQLTE